MIVINNSWRLAPWAEVLYAADLAWWNMECGAPQFPGLKISQDPAAATKWGLSRVILDKASDRLQLDRPGTIGNGGNSGFQALNLAVQFGASKIALVGFDMRIDLGVHWHGKHPRLMNNPSARNAERWRRCLDGAAETLKALGIEVINCSPVSTLMRFPKMSLEEVLAC